MVQETDPQEIHFRNDLQNLELSGLLFMPTGNGPFPAVVIIHGSGDSSRQNKWYLTYVHHLVDHGIVVLLPDKRGSESSGGNWRNSSFEDLATDSVAAVNYLSKRDDLNISSLGLLAISQGGWIAPIAASNSSDVSFIVNIVGTSVKAHEQLLYEEGHNLKKMGLPYGLARVVSHMSSFWLRKVSQSNFWKAIGNFDPIPYWRRIEIPTLVLYGSDDTNVPSHESKIRFDNLHKDNITVKIFEGSGHALQDPAGQGKTYIRQEVLEEVSDFIDSIVATR